MVVDDVEDDLELKERRMLCGVCGVMIFDFDDADLRDCRACRLSSGNSIYMYPCEECQVRLEFVEMPILFMRVGHPLGHPFLSQTVLPIVTGDPV